MIHLSDITRLEVIDDRGRILARTELNGVKLSGQDGGRTLKVFIDEGEDENPTFIVMRAALHLLSKGCYEAARATLEKHLDEMGLNEDTP